MVSYYIWYDSVSIMVQTLRLSRKCLLQTDITNWLRGKILDIPKFHSKNLKLANFTRLSFIINKGFISLPLLKLLEDVLAPVHD